jgi:hypothetical protein
MHINYESFKQFPTTCLYKLSEMSYAYKLIVMSAILTSGVYKLRGYAQRFCVD